MPENDEPTEEQLDEAETYLDAIGNAIDFLGDQLGATDWRRDVDREPVAWPNFPSAHITGGNVSIQENAAHVATMADDTTVQSALASCEKFLDDATAAIAHAADHVRDTAGSAAELLGGQEGATVHGQGMQVVEALEGLMGQVQAAKKSTEDTMGLANAFRTALRDAASKHLS